MRELFHLYQIEIYSKKIIFNQKIVLIAIFFVIFTTF